MHRLLFISHTSEMGGPPHSLLNLIHHLRDDFEVAVLLPEIGSFAHKLSEDGVPSYILRTRIRTLPAVARLIRREGIDLVYGNNYSRRCYLGFWASRLAHRPHIWHIRELLRDTSLDYSIALRNSESVIAISQAVAETIQRQVPKVGVTVVHNGVDVKEFAVDKLIARKSVQTTLSISPEAKIVLNVGNVCARKNQLASIEIAAQVLQRCQNVVFCFIGDLTKEPNYSMLVKERSRELGIEQSVYFLGFQARPHLFLCASDILLHTPTREPHGRSILEAMAAGLPVVSYAIDGICESALDGKTAFLVSPGDTNGAANAIVSLLENPALRKDMGECGFRRVKQDFSAGQTAQKVRDVILGVLNQGHRRPYTGND